MPAGGHAAHRPGAGPQDRFSVLCPRGRPRASAAAVAGYPDPLGARLGGSRTRRCPAAAGRGRAWRGVALEIARAAYQPGTGPQDRFSVLWPRRGGRLSLALGIQVVGVSYLNPINCPRNGCSRNDSLPVRHLAAASSLALLSSSFGGTVQFGWQQVSSQLAFVPWPHDARL